MIIGLIGKKGSGKTTASKRFVDHYDFKLVPFKDQLIKEMKKNFPDTIRELTRVYNLSVDELFTQKPPIMRALLQNYGTEVRRGDSTDYWISKWEETVRTYHEFEDVVVDDVRFINEAETIKSLGGVLVYIALEGQELTDKHVSETEMDQIPFEYMITASRGDIGGIYKQIDLIYEDAKIFENRATSSKGFTQ